MTSMAEGSARLQGLTTAEVEQQRADGRTNDVADATSRSIGDIVRANVFTPFQLPARRPARRDPGGTGVPRRPLRPPASLGHDRRRALPSARKWSAASFDDQGAWLLGAADILLTRAPAGIGAIAGGVLQIGWHLSGWAPPPTGTVDHRDLTKDAALSR